MYLSAALKKMCSICGKLLRFFQNKIVLFFKILPFAIFVIYDHDILVNRCFSESTSWYFRYLVNHSFLRETCAVLNGTLQLRNNQGLSIDVPQQVVLNKYICSALLPNLISMQWLAQIQHYRCTFCGQNYEECPIIVLKPLFSMSSLLLFLVSFTTLQNWSLHNT